MSACRAGLAGGGTASIPRWSRDIKDPDGQGRVNHACPGRPTPARSVTRSGRGWPVLMAGNNRGTWFIPDVGDEVLVAFEGGDPARPYVVGCAVERPGRAAASMDGAGRNNLKVLRSRNGVKVTLDDQDGQEKMVLETPGGQKMTLKDGPGTVEMVDQQRQLDQDGVQRDHDQRVGQAHTQRQHGDDLGGEHHGECRFVHLQRPGRRIRRACRRQA